MKEEEGFERFGDFADRSWWAKLCTKKMLLFH